MPPHPELPLSGISGVSYFQSFLLPELPLSCNIASFNNKYVSFIWDNLPDVDTAHLVRLWVSESNLMYRSHEFLKQVGFEEFQAVQMVRLHTSSTHFVDPPTRYSSKNIRV